MRKIQHNPTNQEDPQIARAAQKAIDKALASWMKHRGKRTERKQIRRIFEAGRSFEAQIAIQGLEAQKKLLEQYEKEIAEVIDAFTEIHRIAIIANPRMKKDEIILALGLIAAKSSSYARKEEEKKS